MNHDKVVVAIKELESASTEVSPMDKIDLPGESKENVDNQEKLQTSNGKQLDSDEKSSHHTNHLESSHFDSLPSRPVPISSIKDSNSENT